ncbi:SIS domain-containing protein [Thiohalobacter thiocyanaticus]|uniref:SIS domain-containing protein n=1 Tax=Thiohalobacter thiocyanaticus TaxID=585455 RepID=A0A426QLL4_9GAMM|nr:SIS domain-containing protein [Thiohalobacter thiocyanaticus]RRQ22648.1 SIS domain-containing protein [Thiohalobacter thiocyanaticus]
MNLFARITQQFNDSIHAKQNAMEAVAPGIAHAAEVTLRALLEEHKILACGSGASAAEAQRFAAAMLSRFELARPGLPAIALNTDGAALTAIAEDSGYEAVFARQVTALGAPGDILLAIATGNAPAGILQAVQAAHDRDMTVVALTGGVDSGELADLLINQDVEIRVPAASAARIREVQVLVIHCLCDLIDYQLLGQET